MLMGWFIKQQRRLQPRQRHRKMIVRVAAMFWKVRKQIEN